MKSRPKKNSLTFGDFVAAAYEVCGNRRARAIVQFAVNAGLLQFRGQRRFLIGRN